MGGPAKHQATYEDLRAVPSHLIAELIHGTIVTQPRPAAPHALATSVLNIELGGPFHRGKGGGPGGWVILYEPELHLRGGHVLVPDLAGWRREAMDPPRHLARRRPRPRRTLRRHRARARRALGPLREKTGRRGDGEAYWFNRRRMATSGY
jgi:hypothetical protein